MSKTHVDMRGKKFLINGELTYSEIEGGNASARGLLMNARFIQGIFDDKAKPERFARFGKDHYDPERNTDELIAALPQWYAYGLRAFTVGLQGGGPVFTVDDFSTIHNTPFSEDGRLFDSAYEGRLHRLLRAADDIGMVVIVSLFYQAQAMRLRDGEAVRNAVKTACAVLRNGGYGNVIVEVANEHNAGRFDLHPIIYSAEGMAYLIDLAREHSGMPAGCSGIGGYSSREISQASDVLLIHGNGCPRQRLYNLIKTVEGYAQNRPVVINEDSPCIGKMEVTFQNEVSWGYYNNLTKQEPPADWSVTPGEDTFFARRMAQGIGIQLPELPEEEQYYFQGFEPQMTLDGKRWLRMASQYPEMIDRVGFYRNGSLMDMAYDEPFMMNNETDWIQKACPVSENNEEWRAIIYLRGGKTVEKTAMLH